MQGRQSTDHHPSHEARLQEETHGGFKGKSADRPGTWITGTQIMMDEEHSDGTDLGAVGLGQILQCSNSVGHNCKQSDKRQQTGHGKVFMEGGMPSVTSQLHLGIINLIWDECT